MADRDDPIAEFADARRIAGDLYRETERLNEVLDAAERKLQNVGLNVAACVQLPSGDELHFRKQGSDWGMFVRVEHRDDFTAWKETPRRTRVEIGRSLTPLLAKMREVARQHVSDVADAVKEAEAFNA